jgi:DNA modification methylase
MSVSVLVGDCRHIMKTLPAGSIDTVVTSPPYFGLRDYDVDGQLGLEATPAEFIDNMVGVFREVRRVLRDDGTLWLNMGDSYANDGKWGGSTGGRHPKRLHGTTSAIGRKKRKTGLKPKDLMGMPWALAFALRDDGWFLRKDNIWHKVNPMPESVWDRPTTAHEYLFLFSKSGDKLLWRHLVDGRWTDAEPEPDWIWRHRSTREESRSERTEEGWYRVNLWRGFDYFYDATAIMEPSSPDSHARAARGRSRKHKYADGGPGGQTIAMLAPSAGRPGVNPKAAEAPTDGPGRVRQNASWSEAVGTGELVLMRNKRSVWSVTSEPYKGAHFATFPTALIEPCILAGCRPGGTVLDPFGGSGTTGLVADRLQRNAVLIELNPEYADMARARIRGEASLLAEVG